ncbi:MAG: T9SS type A sorting domain-containing protein [Saprospiraceae bacterium]|nr:T9SS type A sorting domain-containing protein [Saprospiraceae bacterium]
MAISRVNGQDTMGFGRIGSIILRIKDDIYTSETVQNTFYFIDAELMTVQEQPLPLAPEIRPYIIKPMTTSTQNILDQHQISIYPNPSDDQLFWTTERTDIMAIDIFNIRGQRTHHLFKSDVSRIDISNLPDGLYQVHFRTLEGTISKRFVVTGN